MKEGADKVKDTDGKRMDKAADKMKDVEDKYISIFYEHVFYDKKILYWLAYSVN